MAIEELSLAVVGIGYENADGSSRIDELAKCRRGEPVELRLEPENEYDSRAIAVFSIRGVQIGYVTALRAGWIFGRIVDGELAIAVFQDQEETSAVIRVRFGGDDPSLPRPRPGPAAQPRARRSPPPVLDWYPDRDGPMWGA